MAEVLLLSQFVTFDLFPQQTNCPVTILVRGGDMHAGLVYACTPTHQKNHSRDVLFARDEWVESCLAYISNRISACIINLKSWQSLTDVGKLPQHVSHGLPLQFRGLMQPLGPLVMVICLSANTALGENCLLYTSPSPRD